MKPKISVIIPVYNNEKCISKTIDSVIKQTMQDFEILCINDGSKDNSLEILKKLEEKEKRIKIIEKENEGVWKARVDGVKNAKGEYIAFIDSDDIIKIDFLEKLYKSIEEKKSDIAICGFQRIDFETKKVLSGEMKYSNDRIIDMNVSPEEVITINTALWNKLYKTSLLKNIEDIEKPPRILEDMMYLSLAYLKTQKISFVDEFLYDYMVMEGSAMNTSKKGEVESIQNAMLEIRKKYIKEKTSKEKQEILASMAFLHFGISVMLNISKNEEINFKEEYFKNLLFLDENFKVWRKTKYLNLIYCIKNNKSNLKVAIMKKIYILHCFRLFIGTYKFITKKLKIAIKWW